MRRIIIFSFSVIVFSSACQKKKQENSSVFAEGYAVGTLTYSKIDEASGLDASINNPGKFWTHNDSAGDARVFLIDSTGNYTGSVVLKGIVNRDWEDIAVGVGPKKGKHYIYIAEIGDNKAVHDLKYIYRFEEPILGPDQELTLAEVDTITFQLADGKRDAEALMIDDETGDLYLFSKREKQISLYTLPFPQRTDTFLLATKLLTLPFTQIVAADYNSTTGEALIKNYDSVFYWKKKGKESIAELFGSKPQILSYEPEPQGEAICFALNGTGYYTLSEEAKGVKPALLFYKRKQPSEK